MRSLTLCLPVSTRLLGLAAFLQLLLPRAKAADDSVSAKHQSYQEGDGRIRVDSQYGYAEGTLPAEIKVKLTGVIDSISGATPTGELRPGTSDPVVLADMTDRRKAWHADVGRQFGNVNVEIGYDNSRESDYVSNAGSFEAAIELNNKNTTVLAGVAYSDDEVKSVGSGVWRKKRATDGRVGITQLLGPSTSVAVAVSLGRSTGFHNDPYKLVAKTIEILPGLQQRLTFAERRPDFRNKRILTGTLNHTIRPDMALEAGYRLYDDSFGVLAHTVHLQLYKRLFSDRVLLIPSLRLHRQTAADFYFPDLDQTVIVPETDPAQLYSSDYRLAKLETLNLGLKLVWFAVPDRLSFDASYDRYRMKGRDALTNDRMFPEANIYTVGAKFSW
ncbi:MAG: DUF3570 domain-containing protein [Opitutaceae bacterium]|nr:DUF3570 domain-containing protein [Opitutaceae bacterium]